MVFNMNYSDLVRGGKEVGLMDKELYSIQILYQGVTDILLLLHIL